MNQDSILQAHAMPVTNPAYPRGPFKFVDREYFIITYETDMDALRKVVPDQFDIDQAIVKYEFIKMPNSSGFGHYMESGQVISVSFKGQKGGYVHSMYLNDEAPIAAGREIWGFPKKLAEPKLRIEKDCLIGTLHYGSIQVAIGSMGYKYNEADKVATKHALSSEPIFLLKVIPHVNGTNHSVCELIKCNLKDVNIKGCWTGPAALHLIPHALAPVADLPVKRILSSLHVIADLTLPYGEVIHDT